MAGFAQPTYRPWHWIPALPAGMTRWGVNHYAWKREGAMEIATLAAGLAGFLGPLVPYLVKGSEKAAETFGQQLGQAGGRKAAAVWDKLRDRLGKDSAALQAMAKDPKDQDAQAALRVALRQSLQADPALAAELAALLQDAEAATAQRVEIHGNGNVIAQGAGAVAAGHGSVAIGGSVKGSIISTNAVRSLTERRKLRPTVNDDEAYRNIHGQRV